MASQKILVVEDDESLNLMLGVALTRAGYEVVAAHDGVQAMAKFWQAVDEGKFFGVILLDCALPRLDGFSVALNIRRAEKAAKDVPKARIAAITAYSKRVEDSHILNEIEFDGYFTKPYDMKNILHIIGRWLGRTE